MSALFENEFMQSFFKVFLANFGVEWKDVNFIDRGRGKTTIYAFDDIYVFLLLSSFVKSLPIFPDFLFFQRLAKLLQIQFLPVWDIVQLIYVAESE